MLVNVAGEYECGLNGSEVSADGSLAIIREMADGIVDVPFIKRSHPRFEFEVLSLSRLFQRKLRYPIDRPHRMQFYSVMLVTRGEGQHILDFQAHLYRPGTLLFVAQHQVQQFVPNADSDGIIIVFTQSFLYAHADDRALLNGYAFNPALRSPALQLSEPDFHLFSTLAGAMQHEYARADDAFKEDIVRNLLRVLLLHAERLKRASATPPLREHYDGFARFADRLEAQFARTRNVQEYARALGMSEKALNKLTNATVNMPAKAFIDARVVLEIKRLLAHTDLSLKEIAEQTGFDEPTNLVKFFKRHAGQTPMHFRDGLRST